MKITVSEFRNGYKKVLEALHSGEVVEFPDGLIIAKLADPANSDIRLSEDDVDRLADKIAERMNMGRMKEYEELKNAMKAGGNLKPKKDFGAIDFMNSLPKMQASEVKDVDQHFSVEDFGVQHYENLVACEKCSKTATHKMWEDGEERFVCEDCVKRQYGKMAKGLLNKMTKI